MLNLCIFNSDEMAFLLEEAILWIEDSCFGQKKHFNVKNLSMMDFFITNTAFPSTRHYLMDWSGVDYLL